MLKGRLGPKPHTIHFLLSRVVAVALSAMTLGFVACLVVLYAAEKTQTREEMTRTVRALSSALDQELLKSIAALETLGVALVEADDLRHFHAVASRLDRTRRDWSQVTLRDASGVPVVTTAVSYGEELPRTTPLADLTARALATGQPQVSNLIFGHIAKGPVVAIFVPVTMRDGRQFVLSAAIRATAWAEFMGFQGLPSAWVLGIIDANGIVIARSRGSASYVGHPAPRWVADAISEHDEGFAFGKSLDGDRIALVHTRSKLAGWSLELARPLGDLAQSIWMSVGIVAATLTLVFGISAWLLTRLSQRLSKAIQRLGAAADSIQDPTRDLPTKFSENVAEIASVLATLEKARVHLKGAEESRLTSMRELQHRMKNDLQSLASILAIERAKLQGPDTLRALTELETQIDALRLVHAQTYEMGESDRVEIGEYLCGVVGNSANLHGRTVVGGICLDLVADKCFTDHDTAFALGLIANEFVTNSAKHAFPNGFGTITLGVHAAGDGGIRVVLADNGTGLPAVLRRSSGMSLINALCDQIGASHEWRSRLGTSLEISCPKAEPAAPAAAAVESV